MSDREFLEPDHDEEEYGDEHRVGHGPASSNHALRKWGDEHQYDAAPMQAHYDPTTGVLPKVHLVWMTPDPLGAIAAACRMYEGKPTYNLHDITDEERRHYWEQAQATHLKAPLEFVKFHFFIEGVDRAFTHQMVRQRTAVYAQESMRFAVMGGNFLEGTSLPPSLHGTEQNEPWDDEMRYYPTGPEGQKQIWRDHWDHAIREVERVYQHLVETGMPAEEARGLLPHAMATRLNYATDLRALLDHAGNRLCTQAQFHWRLVFAQMAKTIREYHEPDFDHPDTWQFEALSKVFRPVCYEQGKCPFNATFDRDCSIKERVTLFAENGVPSSEWHKAQEVRTGETVDVHDGHGEFVRTLPVMKTVDGISPEEWALDPSAARRR